MKRDYVFTSESVTEGHPDKLCDQVSDAILDRFLEEDDSSRVSAECAVSNSLLFIAARFSSRATVDFPNVARRVIQEVGYERHEFNSRSCTVLTSLKEVPPGPAVAPGIPPEEQPATHQVTVFGFACRQTPALMPLPIWLAHRVARRLREARRGALPFLEPDGRAQVAVEYRDRRPRRIHSITLVTSRAHPMAVEAARLRQNLTESVIEPAFLEEEIKPDARTELFIDPDGPLVVGGPSVHSGLTGRKTAVDTYGEYSRHSERALSGKDPLRVDRIGTYMARYAAKNVVAAGLAEECEVLLSYSIGRARPVSVQVETFGTGRRSDDELVPLLEAHLDFRVGAIVKNFNLRGRPALSSGGFYRRLAAYGHVGRTDLDLPWERTDQAEALREEGRALSLSARVPP